MGKQDTFCEERNRDLGIYSINMEGRTVLFLVIWLVAVFASKQAATVDVSVKDSRETSLPSVLSSGKGKQI